MAGDDTVARPSEVTFHNIKSNLFRVVHVDGAIVGITPGLYLHCALFNERIAIPQQETHGLTPDGTLQKPAKQTITRGGVVREIEVDAMMSLEAAKVLRDLLVTKIAELEKAKEQLAAERAQRKGTGS